MARPLRLEFVGALYHITSRGDGREDIFLSDHDRLVGGVEEARHFDGGARFDDEDLRKLSAS